MKAEIKERIDQLKSQAYYLELTATNIANNLPVTTPNSGNRLNRLIESLDSFFRELKLLCSHLDGVFDQEVKDFVTALQDSRDILHGGGISSTVEEVGKALKVLERSTYMFSEISTLASNHVALKIEKLQTEDESDKTMALLIERVAKLECGLEAAHAKIAQLKANQAPIVSNAIERTSDKSSKFF